MQAAKLANATVIIAFVLLSNLHPDFKLGLLLLLTAALLAAGGPNPIWYIMASDRLGVGASEFGWITAAAGLGGLAIVPAVIWVDSRSPHGVVATGALTLGVGLFLLNSSESLLFAVPAALVASAGGAAVGTLIYYAVAIKGHTRFKGALIGALGLVFSFRWDVGVTSARDAGFPAQWAAVILPLASGILILVLLTRLFRTRCGVGQSFRAAMAIPGAKVLFLWTAAVYTFGTVIRLRGTIYLDSITVAAAQGPSDLALGYQITAFVGGFGSLLWGIAADYFPARWLLIALALLSLPAAVLLWVPDWQAVGMLLMLLVLGGLVSLPWVLMAECLPHNHFAKLALAITFIGEIALSLESLLISLGVFSGHSIGILWILGTEITAGVVVVACRPRMPDYRDSCSLSKE